MSNPRQESWVNIVADLEATAHWRRLKAEEYPEDERNANAVELLTALAEHVEALSDSDKATELTEINESLSRLAQYDWLDLIEETNEYRRQIGFSEFPANGDVYLERLLSIYRKGLSDAGQEIARIVVSNPETKVTSPPEIPGQGPSPHFVIRNDGKLDFAPSEALDRAGNNVARLRLLHPTLRDLARRLCEVLQTGNIPHANLLERANTYYTQIDDNLDALPFDRLYVEGLRLTNAAATAQSKIAENELPSLSSEANEVLQSVVDLHGVFMLCTAVGLELIAAEERYKRRPQEEAEVRKYTLAFAEELKRRPDLADAKAAEFILKAAEEVGAGSNPERSTVVGVGTAKNAVIVVLSAATIGALPLIGMAVAGPAGVIGSSVATLVGYEALKRTSSFQVIAGIVTRGLNNLTEADFVHTIGEQAQKLAPFAQYVLNIESTLQNLGEQSQFRWLGSSIEWLKGLSRGRGADSIPPSTSTKEEKRFELKSLTVISGTMGPQAATMTLSIDGDHRTTQGFGSGYIEAVFDAIKKLISHKAVVELYQTDTVIEKEADIREIAVRLSGDGKSVIGRAADRDVTVALARAYLDALDKFLPDNRTN